MFKYYLAIDIGASSGRAILAHIENGKMILEEIYRFPNGMTEKNGCLFWDTKSLFENVLTGMEKCAGLGKIPESIGIDTWAVDYVLLDKKGNQAGDVYAYRDSRTEGMDNEVYKVISEEELYARTGIQKQKFNTIYQLMAQKKEPGNKLEKAEKLLMIPDYFNYLLTGNAVCEYTNATTTQLVSTDTGDWDMELIEKLGYPKKLFQKIVLPGTCIGHLTKEIRDSVGYDCKVVAPATHDTGSAVMAVPALDDSSVYISSGTWSLMGTELKEARCDTESRRCNFTNEGGYDHRFRYLKNIMGLWMIQSVKKEIAEDLSFGEICEMASKTDIKSIVDCNDSRFLAPDNMTEEVKRACGESGMQVPQTTAEVAAVIYNSLAKCYAATMKELESIVGKVSCIHIVGGGSNADYLNMLTAKECGCTVYAGPTEATAAGNIAAQMIADGALTDLKAARKCIFDSFQIKEYK